MYGLPLLVLFSAVVAAATVGIAPAEPVGGRGDPLIRQVVSSGGGEGGDDPVLGAERHFSDFKLRFGKAYATPEEHDRRFGVFKANLRRAALHQKLDPSAAHGVTKFSDLTPGEFRRKFLGLKRLRLPADANKAPVLPTDDLPTEFDWRDRGAVTGVKDQVNRSLLVRTKLLFCTFIFAFQASRPVTAAIRNA